MVSRGKRVLMSFLGIAAAAFALRAIAVGNTPFSFETKEVARGVYAFTETQRHAVVYVPDTKTLVTGDILVHPFPFATQSYIGEGAGVLRTLEQMDTVATVPGHGPVLHDKRYLVDIAELMESIATQVRGAFRPDIPLEELRKRIDIERFRAKIAGSDPFLNANFAYTIQSAIDRAYQEVSGRLEQEAMPK